MEKEQFNLMAYAVAMEDYDRALTIAKELKEFYVTTKDNTLASIFEKIENALVYRKNKEYDKGQELWEEISVLAKNRDNRLSVFAKACYYDAIADSAEEDTAKKLEYQKKVKREFEKIGDRILILLVSSWLEELPEKRANIYEEIAEEFNKANLGDFANQAMGWHYHALTETAESPKEKAELFKKAADEFKTGKRDDSYHLAMSGHYSALTRIPESPKERAELFKKAADEFKTGKSDDLYHSAMGGHYSVLTMIPESPKEKAELWKKAADEFKTGKRDDLYHWAMGWHCYALTETAESPKEVAELLKDAADEFKAGKSDDLYPWAMGKHYSVLARATESLEERAKLNKKAAEKFKKGKDEKRYKKEMAWYCYLTSLLSEDKLKREDLKSKAVKQTDWLFIANIALSLSKITKKTEKLIYLIKDAISSYERYLDEKGKKLPTFTIFIDGNLRDKQMVKSVTEKTGGYFITKVSPILKNKPVEIDELDKMIERTDFILMLVENDVNEMLSFEMGLAYTAGKPVVLFVPGDISRLNPIFSKAATITQKLETAITVLRLFSIIKSGEILEVDKDEKEKITDFLKSLERIEIPQPKIEFKASLIEEEMHLKQKQGRLGSDKV
ncbi:MAG: hypothetical protein WBB08_07625 [Halobacteriota archaeon]